MMGKAERAIDASGERDLDLSRYLPQMLNRLAARMNERLAEELATIDLPIAHWRILAILNWRGPCTLKELREWTVIDLSTASRAVKRLEEEGYVMRDRQMRDKRSRLIQLTEAGKSRYREGWTIVSGFHAHVFADLSPVEHEKLLDALNDALQRLERSVWSG